MTRRRGKPPSTLLTLAPGASILGLGLLLDSFILQCVGVAALALALLLSTMVGGW